MKSSESLSYTYFVTDYRVCTISFKFLERMIQQKGMVYEFFGFFMEFLGLLEASGVARWNLVFFVNM